MSFQRFIYTAVAALLLLPGCSSPQERKMRDAVSSHLALYPEARLQDIYKAFFQAEFGAEHIVADTASAGRYLDRELEIPDHSDVFFEPIGADSTYYRVHLRTVQDGYITRNRLFRAFIGGVSAVEDPQIARWKERWPVIEKIISGMGLDLPGYDEDSAMIDSVLASGSYAVHHSEAFGKAYAPHYRIIRRDLFEKDLLPYLPR